MKSFNVIINSREIEVFQDKDGRFLIPDFMRGLGTSGLKPAAEEWILVRRPLECKTVAENVLEWGCGGINIDASRIDGKPRTTHADGNYRTQDQETGIYNSGYGLTKNPTPSGRFPANFILSHNEDCELLGEKKVQGTKWGKQTDNSNEASSIFGIGHGVSERTNKFSGTETVSDYACTEGCAVAELDRQSGVSISRPHKNKLSHESGWKNSSIGEAFSPHNDSGGASRFFYIAKASKRDKNEGCEGLEYYVLNNNVDQSIIDEINMYL